MSQSPAVFELPLNGATAYASVELILKKKAETTAEVVGQIAAGSGFRILQEKGAWWQVETTASTGWIESAFAFLNLPDVLPSIVFNCTNTYSAIYRSCGKEIPEITGKQLYNSRAYNERLGKDSYIAPVLYPMSKKIAQAQKNALAQGETLVIYEGFRPYPVQQKVSSQLAALAEKDDEIKAGISTAPWELEWFIADSISNHQRGYAFDVSLAKVKQLEKQTFGPFSVEVVSDYEEYQMYTPMHELSQHSCLFTAPVYTKDPVAWKDSTVRSVVNEEARRLQHYCIAAGLIPLASEWWHFNDLDARTQTLSNQSDGNFILTEMFSRLPEVTIHGQNVEYTK